MGLRVICRPALALLAAGAAGFLIPALATPAQAGRPSTAAEHTVDRRLVSVERGDTLMDVLTGASVPRAEAEGAIAALNTLYDPRRLQVGQQIAVLFEPHRAGHPRFAGLEVSSDAVRSVSVTRATKSGFTASETKKEVRRQLVAAQTSIRSSLFEAAGDADIPTSIIMAAIRTYSYDVDFQRDLQPGDRFAVLYERYVTADGKSAGEGDLLFASLTVGGDEIAIYRYKDRDGRIDYYNRDGESIRRALLMTPIDGARLTSGFGMRKHPILGYSKMHRGVDFGAPPGTPVYAAGDGVIEEAGQRGGYGNYVRIRHNTQITTAYAHLSRFGKAARRGARIEQGQVIGYVGATGRVTGPHLHYEVLKAGQQVNPKSEDLPTGDKLAGRELQAFRETVRSLDRDFIQARSGLQIARAHEKN